MGITVVKAIGLWPTFIIEGNAKFPLEVSENKEFTFSPSKFMNPWVRGEGLSRFKVKKPWRPILHVYEALIPC